MRTLTSSLQQRLQNSRRYVAYAAGLAYLLYVLVTTVFSPPGGLPQSLQGPKYWAALITVCGGLTLLAAPSRLREISLAAFIGYLTALIFEVPKLVELGLPPLHLGLWLNLEVMVCFLVFGSRWGAGLGALIISVMLLALVLGGPQSATRVSDWTTVILVLVVTGFISYVSMSFTERNLLMSAQDREKLRAARLDAVTEVYGRGAIEEELQRALRFARESNTPMSVIVTDIDHFKAVNDRYGHATGDDVLRAVAKRLRRNVGGSGGLVGRWGGEEFVVLLPGISKTDALAVAERLRREISEQPLADLRVTASFGVAAYRGAHDTPDQLFGRADLAMYEAKNAGRNAVR
ncbi:GGDEF domain-containing protein [Deinococcus aerophilus]|uniref:GGDEF domain-containing protein n=1 Tax=Deinococcus aerophilus TaxID=522488 RepID=UPI001E394F31|nr:GGDEF domain-containing protein [Deinococcus aerophilus]